ncbi:hypothetical protein T310_7920 [Rasamsonia emersonii CBS 393.64]|uniref:Uncharacterized protein n=1 Tax=Rasamsonia emersonii (strain ATCC 16479 / CBS 393.64 / IMI 116815) TaxID=1408163 RepID=A0A0F4YJ55_RASE3|nr:hypothetical protein T310_7920 [Rasamsonia emersonii CBS 393.64]KKA18135.1 hypothetical protein T310_7920 [Rasamsonia emersonii CBS 393.64]
MACGRVMSQGLCHLPLLRAKALSNPSGNQFLRPLPLAQRPISCLNPQTELIKSDKAALLDHDQCKQARPKTKELLQVCTMDPQQDAIDHILEGVESIQNLKRDTVEALRNAIVGRILREYFRLNTTPEVKPEEFTIWSNENDLGGIEYDAHLESIIIEARQGPVHGKTVNVISDWFKEVVGKVQEEDNMNLSIYQDKTFCLTSGKYRGRFKAPDSSIVEKGSFRPLIALEVAFSSTRKDLLEDAKAWLYGTNNITELVIAIDIKEQSGKNDSKEDSYWGLSDAEILQRFKTDDALTAHIIRWDQDHGNCSLVGTFTAEMWFCTRETCHPDSTQLPPSLWTYEFSLNKPLPEGKFIKTFYGAGSLGKTFRQKFCELEDKLPLEALERQLRDSLEYYREDRASVQAWNKRKALEEAEERKKQREDRKRKQQDHQELPQTARAQQAGKRQKRYEE